MIRVTLVPGAGSEGPRKFIVAQGPEVAPEGDATGRVLTRFVTRTGRIVRVPHADVLKVEERPGLGPKGEEWTNDDLERGWRPVAWPPTTRPAAADPRALKQSPRSTT